MEAKKNLCGMIPEELHARAVAEKEQLGLKTLGEYVELILKEHFEGGKTIMAATKTLAFQISEELDQRLKNFIAAEKTGPQTADNQQRRQSADNITLIRQTCFRRHILGQKDFFIRRFQIQFFLKQLRYSGIVQPQIFGIRINKTDRIRQRRQFHVVTAFNGFKISPTDT